MNKFASIKSRVAALVLAASPLSLLAEGESGGGASAVQTEVVGMMTTAQTNLQSLLSAALPVIGGVLGAAIVLWAGFKLFRLIMKAFGWGAR